MVAIYPHHSSRRQCEASIKRVCTVPPFLGMIMVADIYTKASILYAPCYGLFMGYMAVPAPTCVLIRLFSVPFLSSLLHLLSPSLYFLFSLRLFFSKILSFFLSSFRLRPVEESALEENVLMRNYRFLFFLKKVSSQCTGYSIKKL